MATHSSVLAWRIPGTAEPGGLPSMGPHRVGHDLATKPPEYTFQAPSWEYEREELKVPETKEKMPVCS